MASVRKPWKRFINRDKVQGGEGGERRSRSRSFAALFARLRRVEIVVTHIMQKSELSDEHLDKVLEMMLSSQEVDAPVASSRSEDERGEVFLPQEAAPDREIEEHDDVVVSDRGRKRRGFTE